MKTPSRHSNLNPLRRFALPTAVAAAVLALTPALPLGGLGQAQAQSLEATRAAARKALQSNPEVTSRLNAYLSKVEGQAAAAAGWLPKVDLNAVGAVNHTQNRGFKAQNLNHGGASLSVTQVLWDDFATANDVKRASHDKLSRWFEFVDATEQTSLDATRAAYDVQRMRKLVSLAEDNLQQHQQAATKLESRLKAGVGRGVDVDQARARLALAEANRDTELANLHDVAARYQRIVGEAPQANMGAAELLRTGLPGNANEALRIALANSAQVAAGVEAMRAARATEAVRQSALHPQLSAKASVGGGKNYNAVDGRKADASVGLYLNWNLFNGGADSARVREQQHIISQAMDQRDKACRDVRQTVLVAFNDANKLTAQLNSLGRNAAAIERARDAYRQQFDIGQRSLLDLLNAENEAYTARRALTNAVYDRAVAYARTLAAMSQLNVQLGLARELPGGDGAHKDGKGSGNPAADWKAEGDGAERCGAAAVEVTPLLGGPDLALAPDPVTAAPVAYAVAAEPSAAAAVAPAAALPVVATMATSAVVSTALTTASTAKAATNVSAATLAEQWRSQKASAMASPKPNPPPARASSATTAPSAAMLAAMPVVAAPTLAPQAAAAKPAAERQPWAEADTATTNALVARVQGWAQAWRMRDANDLFGYYAPDFRGTSASTTAWSTQLRRQLATTTSETDVEIEDLVTRDLGGGVIETRFMKTASNAAGLDTSSVALSWRQVNGQWRIVRERKT